MGTRLLLVFEATFFLSSCMTVNKQLETKTSKLKIKTTVKKYSQGEKAFYGTIIICNQTSDTLAFNFNQSLLINSDTLNADYNIKPISYACIAFDIKPKTCSTWDVRWPIKKEISNFDSLIIKADTTVFISKCRDRFLEHK